MTRLDYLGGALENFYEDDKLNPHLLPVDITVEENEKNNSTWNCGRNKR